ncbi:TetR/AcrR family transcriptional regulator [Sneathiella marina]|uniref:TetR/AcrR family transcriptional regulator n=1 Tax=Sneathiella marina TaxID=2950108 RepID=A0ABY4WD35_9PROT|nr:TetR/AcrR family transcriptional regulator [Sneathiella marina]USG62546.1 TetR/AcrR family transcriptional regulator [Sneathiella marina]
MMKTDSIKEKLLAAAEKRVRHVGFNAVSFRDLAADVGVKSSSVHYYFLKKEDLGEALVNRYAENFKNELDKIDANTQSLIDALTAFVGLYGRALVLGDSVCLCAILGAEVNGLAPRIRERVQAFFQMNTDWLDKRFRNGADNPARLTSLEIVAALEGAMIVSTTLGSREAFDVTAARILKTSI